MLLSLLRGLIRRAPRENQTARDADTRFALGTALRQQRTAEGADSMHPKNDASHPAGIRAHEATVRSNGADVVEARRLLAVAFDRFQAGQFDASEQALSQARTLDADNIDVLILHSAVLQAQGRNHEALELLHGAHDFDADNFELQVAIARLAADVGDTERAARAYGAALEQRPDMPELYIGLAAACETLESDVEAIEAYREVLNIDPNYLGVNLNLGRLLQKRGELLAARRCFEAEIALNPNSVKSLFNLGIVFDRLKDPTSAERCYGRALAIDPHFADAHFNLGLLLARRGEFTAALVQLDLGGKGGMPSVHFNRAVGLAQEGCIAEARAHFLEATRIPPDDLTGHNDIGIMFFFHGCLDEARSLIGHAAAHAPSSPLTQFNLALVKLATAPSVAAWDQFAWRMHPEVRVTSDRKYPFDIWRGESLQDRTLLIWREQGIGDEILFSGMYRQLQNAGARVILECHPKLMALMKRSFPWARVVEWRTSSVPEVCSGIDYQIPAGSLGKHLRAHLGMFPHHDGYLRADPARVQHWRRWLEQLGPGLKVGFCWRSSNMNGDRALSCTRLDDWGELFAIPGIHWLCLQYDECEAELETARNRFGVRLLRIEGVDYFNDLDEVAALMKALDLVISAPTVVSVHAAAMGTPTWQRSYGVDWQTHGTDANPWLPSITRFQRRWDQSWPEVLGDVAARLRLRAGDPT